MSEEEFASNIDDIARALDGKLSEEEIEEDEDIEDVDETPEVEEVTVDEIELE